MGILFLMFIFIILRIVIKNVVYEKMGIYNPVVAFFLEGDNDVSVGDEPVDDLVEVGVFVK